MATTIATLQAVVRANITPLRTGLNAANGLLRGFAGNAAREASLAASAPLIGIGALVLKTASEFSDAYSIIRIGTGATGKALESLQNSFDRVAKSGPDSFKEVANVVGELSDRTGLFGPKLEDVSRRILAFSRATGENAFTSVRTITRMFASWGIETNQMADAMNRLFRAQQLTGVSQNKLADNVTTFGPILRQLGFGWEDSVALIAKFEKEGVATGNMLAGLRLALGRFAKEGIKDPALALRLLEDRFKHAKSAADANTLAIAIFGRRAGINMVSAMREGKFSIDDITKAMRHSREDILKTTQANLTLTQQFRKLGNEVMIAVKPLAFDLLQAFKDLMPLIKEAIVWLSGIARWFHELSPSVKEFAGKVLVGVAALKLLGPAVLSVLVTLLKLGGVVWNVVKAVFGFAAGIGIGATSVIVIIAGLLVAWKYNWGSIREVTADALQFIVTAVSEWAGGLGGIWVGVTQMMAGQWEEGWSQIKDGTSKALGSMSKAMKDAADLDTSMTQDRLVKEKADRAKALADAAKQQKSSLATMAKNVKDQAAIIGKNVANALRGNVAETNRQLDAIGESAKKKAKLTPFQKQDLQMTQALMRARAQLVVLSRGEGTIAGDVAKKYNLLSASRRAELVTVLESIKARKLEIEDNKQIVDEIRRVRAERALLVSKDESEKARAQFQHASQKYVDILAIERNALDKTRREQTLLTESKRKYREELSATERAIRGRRIGGLQEEIEQLRDKMPKATDDQLKFLAIQQRVDKAEDNATSTMKELAKQILSSNGVITNSQIILDTWGNQILDSTDAIQKYVFGVQEADDSTHVFALSTQMLTERSKTLVENIKKLQIELARRQGVDQLKQARVELLGLTDASDQSQAALQLFGDQFKLFVSSAGTVTKTVGAMFKKLPDDLQVVASDMGNIIRERRFIDSFIQVTESIQGIFQDMFTNIREKGFGSLFTSILQGVDNMLVDMASKFLAAKLTQAIVGLVPGAASFLGGIGAETAQMQAQTAAMAASLGAAIATSGAATSAGMSAAITTGGAIASTALSAAVTTSGVTMSTGISASGIAAAAGFSSAIVSAGSLAADAMFEAIVAAASLLPGGGGGKNSQSGDIFGNLFGMFGGGRALGGPVDAGKAYMVGEKGKPEFFLPRTSGTVVPADKMGGDTINIHINVKANDVQSFKASEAQIRSDAMRLLEQAKRRNG